MKKAIDIRIDADLIDKNRFELAQFTDKAGKEKSVRNMDLVIVPLKEEKIVTSGDTWELVKIGFVTQKPTKNEKENKTNLPIIGSATQFRSKDEPTFNRDSQGNEIKGYDKSTSVADDATDEWANSPF